MVRLDAVATLVTMHAGGTIRFMNEVDTSLLAHQQAGGLQKPFEGVHNYMGRAL
jgi:hypothetical protein